MLVHLAALQEFVFAEISEREALVRGDQSWSYAQLGERFRRAGHAFRGLGLGCHRERSALAPWESGQDHVAILAYNGVEWLETMYGALKARAAYINVNYRYKADELVYVLETSGSVALVYHATFAPLVTEARVRLPRLRHLIQIADDSGNALLDGALDYAQLLAAAPTSALDLPYSPDDLYILYTGGTTGMPKGVLWRQEDVFYNGLGGHIPGFPRLESHEQLREHLHLGIGGRALVALPFMHGAGQWNCFNVWHRGGAVILPEETRRLDAHGVWRAVERHRADQVPVVGDAFARPLMEALREGTYDVSSMRMVMSTAAVLSPSLKDELMALLPPGAMLLESVGASEAGLQAMSYDTTSGEGVLPAYQLREGSLLLRDDRSEPLSAGTDEVGWIATSGALPLGYLGDPVRTRETFPVIGGVRYSVGGDRGRFAVDGRVLFLGRESVCINTGGEKVYVEEVERVVKAHPAVYDALVVPTPSTRWGQQVTAVLALKPGVGTPTLAELRAHCAPHLADYKVPKALAVAPAIARADSGKPDYAWARAFAEAHAQ